MKAKMKTRKCGLGYSGMAFVLLATMGCGSALNRRLPPPPDLSTFASSFDDNEDAESSCLKPSVVPKADALPEAELEHLLERFLRARDNFTANFFQVAYEAHVLGTSGKPVNMIFSPFSIWQALGLAYLISGGNLKTDMEANLGFSEIGKENVYRIFKSLESLGGDLALGSDEMEAGPVSKLSEVMQRRQLAAGVDGDVEASSTAPVLESANRIYVSAALAAELTADARALLDDEVRSADFARDAEGQRAAINEWVSTVTRGKIPNFLTSRDVRAATAMVLANAAYFKGTWANKFEVKDTKPDCFFLDPDRREAVTVPTMHLRGARVAIRHDEHLQSHIVQLPYSSGSEEVSSVSMFLIVPDENPEVSVDIVAKLLTPEVMRRAFSDIESPGSLPLFTMPKFKLETTLQLAKSLQKLGLGSLFDNARSNLECLSPTLRHQGFTRAKHMAMIEVNEEGSEAAAATSFISTRIAGARLAFDEFRVDRPFIYAIVLSYPTTVLFMGVVKNPGAQTKKV